MTERLIDDPAAFIRSRLGDVLSPPVAGCSCGHDAARHDRTAQRYCSATASNDLRRGCICNVARRNR